MIKTQNNLSRRGDAEAAEFNNMAVEIVMFDDQDRPERRNTVSLADYLNQTGFPVVGQLRRQG